MKKFAMLGAGLAAFVQGMGATAALAQDSATADEASQFDIVVTAQKRSERLLDVPASIAAFDGERLTQGGSNTLESLNTMVPSLQFSTSEGKGQPAIRGIGNQFLIGAAESAVATHIDGFYIPRLSGVVGSFLDIERIEVLKGPQGTLYGRNATAGTINIITNKPTDETELRAAIEGIYIDRGDGTGGGSGLKASAVVNVPVSDTIRTRLAVMKVKRDGYVKAYYPNGDKVDVADADEIYVRAQVDIDLSEKVNWLLATDNFWADDRGVFTHHTINSRADILMSAVALGFQTGGKSRRVYFDRPVTSKPKSNAFTSTLSWEASDELTIKSLTQYRYTGYRHTGEFDMSQANLSELAYDIRSKAFSQELQGSFQAGRLRGIVGAYYFQEKSPIDQYFGLQLFGDPLNDLAISGVAKTKAYAVFADLTYGITDTLELTVGGRYSHEKKSGRQAAFYRVGGVNAVTNNGALDGGTFNSFTPKIVLNYRPSTDLTVYISGQKGFKSGGFSIGSLDTNTAFGPEKITAVEAGVKSRLFDRKVGLNLATFFYRYKDLQLEDVIGLVTLTRNVGAADVFGVELDGYVLPVDGLRIDFGATVLDAKANTGDMLFNPLYNERVSLDGKRLPKSSKFTGSSTITYDYDLAGGGTLSPSFTASYRSQQYFTIFNNPRVEQKGYWWLRASLTYKAADDRWSLSLFGDNLTNKFVLTTGVPSTGAYGFPLQSGIAPLRVIGLRLDWKI